MTLAINTKRKLYSYFTKELGVFKYRRGWYRAPYCPSCGKRHKWSVNLTTNRSNCFSCGYNDKPIDVVAFREGFTTTTEVLQFLSNFEEGSFYEEFIEPYQLKDNVSLPEGYVNIRRGKSRVGKIMQEYVVRRGFNLDEVSRAGWGYCSKGEYMGYLIMPFYSNNRLIYFNARRVIGDGTKFKNPNVEDFGLGKSMLLYNIDALQLYNRIFIVESITNARTIGDYAVATGGKKISNFQLNLFLKSPVEKFVIGLDKDGLDDAIDIALKLVQFKKVKIMLFKDDRDINDLGRKTSLNIANRSRYLTYNQLILWKNSL